MGLVDDAGNTQWAEGVDASSTYGVAGGVTGWSGIVPKWSGLHQPSDAFANGSIGAESRGIEARGWPMLPGWTPIDPTAPPRRGDVTRIVPIWTGLIVDTLFWGAAFAILYLAASWPWRLYRDLSRLRAGRCMRCAYDLGYDFAGGCPECGWRRESAAFSRRS